MMKAKQQLPVVLFPPPVYFLLTLSLLWIHRDASAYAFVPHGPFVKPPTRKINSNALLWLSKTTIPIPESSVSINDGAPKPISLPMGWIPSTLTKASVGVGAGAGPGAVASFHDDAIFHPVDHFFANHEQSI
jgi:hypothetical protein